VNITLKEIATRALLAVVVVLAGTVLGAALGTAIGSLIGFGPQGFLVGAFVGSIIGVNFILNAIGD
jgi:F0F1-type ATP synthase assembly protein I